MRLVPTALLSLVAVPAALALPTVSWPAAAPEPVAPRVHSLPLAGVAAGALPSAGARRARPAVLTAPTRTDRFDLVAVTWRGGQAPVGLAVQVRVREHGQWGAWAPLAVEDTGPDAGTAEAAAAARRGSAGTEPLLADGADGVQVRVDSPGGRLPAGLTARLVDGGRSAADAPGAPAASASAVSGVPTVITRAQWGADESLRDGTVDYNTRVRALVLHHTAGSNTYSSAGAYSELRAVYAYHTQVRGWSDIGYNIVVDRFGRIFEGRRGSINSPVKGAHAGGFNAETFGVSVMGSYDTARPSSAAVNAVARVMAWKAQQYGINGRWDTRLTSSGGGTSRYPAGTVVTKPSIMGHRDVGYTECPGAYLYAQLGSLRSWVASHVTLPSSPVQAVVGDWDGDGRDEQATWHDGSAYVQLRSGRLVSFAYGFRGATVVAGDWDGDGKDSLGVFSQGRWYLRNSLSAGVADLSFSYGAPGDVPVVGRWPGMSRGVGVGVVRGYAWYLKRSVGPGAADLSTSFGGAAGDVRLAGDVDGDGVAEPVVVRDGRFLIGSFSGKAGRRVAFGAAADVPMLGDPNGDRRATTLVYRPENFTWYWRDDLAGGAPTEVSVFGG